MYPLKASRALCANAAILDAFRFAEDQSSVVIANLTNLKPKLGHPMCSFACGVWLAVLRLVLGKPPP